MQLWQVILYSVSTLLALRVLVSLMEYHRRYYRQIYFRRMREEQNMRLLEEARAKSETSRDAA